MLHKINYAWRLLGTGLAFASFSIGGFFLALTVFPLIAHLSGTEEKRITRTRSMVSLTFRLFIFMLRGTGVISVEFNQINRLNTGQGRLVIANHPTLLDVVLLVSLMPKAQCLVKHSLLEHRFFGGCLRAAGYIRNDGDPQKLLEQCQKAIKTGHDIVVFPEGTRSTPGNDLKFQRGFANIAALTPCDIQPVVITCKPSTLTKGSKWYEIPPKKANFCITAAEQLDIEPILRHEPRPKAVRKLTRELEDFYNGKLSHG